MGFVASLFGGGQKTPDVVTSDPVADQAKIDAAATEKANAVLADKKKGQRSSALATGASASTDAPATSSALAYGKTQLGA